jgi:hypothetical protein
MKTRAMNLSIVRTVTNIDGLLTIRRRSEMKTFIKRLIALIGMLIALTAFSGAMDIFRDAQDWVNLVKGFILLVVAGIAFWGFLRDFVCNEWPFQGFWGR